MAERIVIILAADEAAMPSTSPCGIAFGEPRREAVGVPNRRTLYAHDWACSDAHLLAALPASAQIIAAVPADWREPSGLPG